MKAVQYGTIAIAGASTSNTATLSPAVDTANSVVVLLGWTASSTSNGRQAPYIQLTNSTTVTATRNQGVNTTTLNFVVITFNGLASVQQGTGTITGANTTGTATITSINTAKTILFFLGFTNDATLNDAPADYPYLALTNATTITGTRALNADTGVTTFAYAVATFS